jgi:hypothetical protein
VTLSIDLQKQADEKVSMPSPLSLQLTFFLLLMLPSLSKNFIPPHFKLSSLIKPVTWISQFSLFASSQQSGTVEIPSSDSYYNAGKQFPFLLRSFYYLTLQSATTLSLYGDYESKSEREGRTQQPKRLQNGSYTGRPAIQCGRIKV